MVVLSRIYTKTGDQGTTALGTGRRVSKDHLRIEAYGTVDELTAGILAGVQNDLFDLGADLCVPEPGRRSRKNPPPRKRLRMTEVHTRRLEQAIDRLNGPLAPLRSFVLPGGTAPSAWLHLARTIARRAERRVVHLARRSKINPQVIIYLNRLSDLLFVMARRSNAGGKADILWQPGGGTEETP
jgi:cob(I)alamin adenosyltransferase